MSKHSTCVYLGDELARYGFGDDHPFGPQRHHVFQRELEKQGLGDMVDILSPATTDQATIELFHTHEYTETVRRMSKTGVGYLDHGDTPAFVGMFEAASTVAGSVLDAIDRIIAQEYKRAFIPIAGLHHARREIASGFCVFNDCGIAIEYLRKRHNIKRVAYVDIDAHHGDGVFYSFEDDPELIFVDLHEDGRYLYPGTGRIEETGKGAAKGTKLNIPMPPRADDNLFNEVWPSVEKHLEKNKPEFILLQGGADSIDGDPITHMAYTPNSHAHAVESLCSIADRHCKGRLLAMGGGGYNHDNIARTWTAVVSALSNH